VGLVLANATLAVALVLGVRVLARFRQPAGRPVPEHDLLAALAGASVAIASGMVAAAALAPGVPG
jgi:hypothetical protein